MPRLSDDRAVWLAAHILPHEPLLRAWLSKRKVLQLEVDDIIQETYAVLAGLDDVGQVQHPKAYMFQVARSIILQHVRRQRIVSIEAMAEIDRLSILSEQRSPEEEAVRAQELRRIAELIAALPEKCREAFILRKVHDLPQREVARQMGVGESTIEKHIGKALRILMKAFKTEQAEAGGSGRKDTEYGQVRRRT